MRIGSYVEVCMRKIRKRFRFVHKTLHCSVICNIRFAGDAMYLGDCEERILSEAKYIVENDATVRSCAAVFGVGKSTVHTDVTKKLKNLDVSLYDDVKKVLGRNLSERHLRGGESTKNRYEREKSARTDTGT